MRELFIGKEDKEAEFSLHNLLGTDLQVSNAESNQIKTVFSSPEHEVLKVSYCDLPMSGVRRVSFVNIFSSITNGLIRMKLHNRHPLNVLTRITSIVWDSCIIRVSMATKLKILLLPNCLTDFQIIL